MTKKKTSATVGAAISAGKAIVAQKIASDAQRRLLERDEGGTFLARVSPEQWDAAIERIRGGDTDANISKDYGIAKGTIAVKRRQDPIFRERYLEALEDAFTLIAQETRSVARGEDGHSSGDVQRDRLIVETDLKLASKFARKLLGDKLEIDHRSVNIVLRGDSDDIC